LSRPADPPQIWILEKQANYDIRISFRFIQPVRTIDVHDDDGIATFPDGSTIGERNDPGTFRF
jgi:hypothetical protein